METLPVVEDDPAAIMFQGLCRGAVHGPGLPCGCYWQAGKCKMKL